MSSTPSLSHSPAELYRAWQDLRAERPQLRARDAAALLQVSEGELVASRVGIDAVRLRPDWAALLPALGELGPIMALTRNEHCVHERKGPYREVTVSANGQMGLVVSPDIDLRLFLGAGTPSSPLPRRHRGVPSAASRCSTSRGGGAQGVPYRGQRRPRLGAAGRAPAGCRAGCRAGAARTPRTGCDARRCADRCRCLARRLGRVEGHPSFPRPAEEAWRAAHPGAAPGWRRMGRAPGQWRPGETLRSGGRKRIADHGVRRQRPLHPDPYRASVQPEVAGRLVQRARSGIQPAPEDHRHRRTLAGAQAEHRWHRNQLGGLRRRRRTDRATVRRAQARRAERDDWRELAESFKAL